MDEVEAVADMVGILRSGRLVAVEHVDELKAKARRQITLTFTGTPPVAALRSIPGVSDVRAEGDAATVSVAGSMEQLMKVAAAFGIRNVLSHEVDLEDIFLAYYSGER